MKYGDSYFSAVRNFLAVRLNTPAQITFDDKKLPSPDEFDPEESFLVVTPYIEVSRYRDALDFLYHQLRGHFSEERAHGQYFAFIVQYGEKTGIRQWHEAVDEESAVYLESLKTAGKRWVVTEDRQPDLARNEYSTSAPTVKNLVGKRRGDIVDLCASSLQPQQERIVDIQSKYVRLFQDVLESFQYRFPGASTIQPIHLGYGENLDPSPLIESLKTHRQNAEEAIDFYRNKPCSLHVLASRLGINQRELMAALVADDDHLIPCVDCSPEEYYEAATAGFDTKKVVLDITAIITISRLNAWHQLGTEWDFLVSRTTSDLIGEWLHERETGSQTAGYGYLTADGKMAYHPVTSEQLQLEHDEIKTMGAHVGSLCAVKSSMAIASLDPKRREQYTRIFGLHSLEAVSVARDENALLWTDDRIVALLAQAEFGVKRVWTQLVFKVLENAGRIADNAYSVVTVKLAGWNYVSTVWNLSDLIVAGNLCDWDVGQWPLKQCIKFIGKCPLPLPGKANLAIGFFRLLRNSPCVQLKQSAVVQAVLNGLGDRARGRVGAAKPRSTLRA